MDRPIKFRAWDNRKKKMRYFDLPTLIGADEPFFVAIKMGIIEDKDIMQFTGLKDKNGKEIYEGDIVKFNIKDEIGIQEDSSIGKIKYFEKWVCFGIKRKEGWYQFTKNTHTAEIIGNIYENPELLEVSQ